MRRTTGTWLAVGVAALALAACEKGKPSAEDRTVGRAIDATLASPSLRFTEEAGADRAEVAIDRRPSPRVRVRTTRDGATTDVYADDKVVLASDATRPGRFIGIGAPCPGRGERAVQVELATTGLAYVADTAVRFDLMGDGGYSSVLRNGGRVEVTLDGGAVRTLHFVSGAAPIGIDRATFDALAPTPIERPSDELVSFPAAGDEAAKTAAGLREFLDFARCPT